MKPIMPGLVALAVLGGWLGSAPAADFDVRQPESPPLPIPRWFKAIDQGENDPRLKGYSTPAGVKVEIVAEFPVVMNPVGMTFADDGSLYVLEWRPDRSGHVGEQGEVVVYKDGTRRTVATMKKSVKDVVKVLRQVPDKAAYNQSQVILEEELPSSILVHDGWLYLSGRGTVRRYRLADLEDNKPDGEGKDPRRERRQPKGEIIAQGFCGFHHHQVSGLTIGNDGWLYVTSGDDDNVVEGSDGSRATVLRTGAVFRCRPDGSKMHVFSIGYRNPYRDVAFDAAFNVFHVDNDNEDGSKFMGCRLMHVAEGSDFGWRLRTGARCCAPDTLRGAAFGELPGKMAPLLKSGRGAPAGLLIYNDSRFPDPYLGLLYYPDVLRKSIRAYKVQPKGSTFVVTEEFPLLKSDDPLFRPCQAVLGPDGAIYVCDWRTNSNGAGQLFGSGKDGRIYRLSWAGTEGQPALPLRGMDSWAKLIKGTDQELFKALASEEFSDRQRAQRELVRRGDKMRAPLLQTLLWPHLDEKDQAREALVKEEPPARARIAALGALQSFWNDAVRDAFMVVLRDPEAEVCRLAAEGLGLNAKPGDKAVIEALTRLLEAPDLAIRRAVFLALGKVGGADAADSLVNAFQFDDGKDAYLTDGLLRAIEHAGKAGIAKLVALAESGDEKDHDRVLEAFLALRTAPAAEAIPGLLKYPHLTVRQRADLLRSYSNYLLLPPVSMEPVLDYLAQHADAPPPVKLAGLEVLSGSPLLRTEKGQKMLLEVFDEPAAAVRLAVIQAVEASRMVKAAQRLNALLANPQRPVSERLACATALRGLNDRSAVPILKSVLDEKEAPLDLKRESLRTLAALDSAAAQPSALAMLDDSNEALQVEAILVLGVQPEGARTVAERFLARKLPRVLLPQVVEALRKQVGKHKDLEKTLTDVLKGGLLVSLDKAEVARIEKLVKSQGNPGRGRSLYLDGKSLACVTCHRLEGVGGNVGPDLSRIWDTHSIDKIMESIIDPSKEIKEGFVTYVATTKKGQTFTGLKVARTAEEVVLRDANAREVRIPAKDLDDLSASKQSLMPENAVAQLSFNQFIDLVAFLKDRAAQESLRGMALDCWIVGPFGDDLKTPHPPESNPDVKLTYPGGKEGEKLSWQLAQADAGGYLNLRAVFNRERSSAYALTYVHSPKHQPVRMLVGAAETARVWLNGEVVFTQGEPRQARPDQESAEVKLKEGWNLVLAKVVRGTDAQGLYLRFTGEGVRVSAKRE